MPDHPEVLSELEEENVHRKTTRTRVRNPSGPWASQYEIEQDERPSMALVDVLATLLDEDPAEVGPLSEAVDLEAIDDLLERPDGGGVSVASVRVDLYGYRLSIDETTIAVIDGEEPAPGVSSRTEASE